MKETVSLILNASLNTEVNTNLIFFEFRVNIIIIGKNIMSSKNKKFPTLINNLVNGNVINKNNKRIKEFKEVNFIFLSAELL